MSNQHEVKFNLWPPTNFTVKILKYKFSKTFYHGVIPPNDVNGIADQTR